jgi:hypothetical protein
MVEDLSSARSWPQATQEAKFGCMVGACWCFRELCQCCVRDFHLSLRVNRSREEDAARAGSHTVRRQG